MKKLLVLCLMSMFIFTSCKKLNKLTQFNIEYDETIVIPSSTGISIPLVVLTPDMQTNSESTFEVHDTRKDLIQSIVLTELKLKVQTPSSGNFNFLKTVRIFIKANGLGEKKIAFKENMTNANLTELSLDLSGDDMQEYIKMDKFSLRVETITDEIITEDYAINLHSVYFVDAKLKK